MTINEFEKFLKRAKVAFKNMLIKGAKLEDYKALMKRIIDECETAFELETVTELLKEEFQNYSISLQNEGSEA